MSPTGSYGSGETFVGISPVAIQVGALHAFGTTQGIGQAVQVSLEIAPDLGDSSIVLACTVAAQTNKCSSAQTGTVPEGTPSFIRITNGPGGAAGGFMSVGYTVQVP